MLRKRPWLWHERVAVVILYEDSELLAVNKPPGVVVIPARDEDPERSLRRELERARGEGLWVVHRIDRETSGVVLFARSAAAHRALNELFSTRAVEKSYVAFTAGARLDDALSVELPLHTARKGKMRPAVTGEAGSLDARTELRVLARWARGSVCVSKVSARPHTGRQHQIRVHLRAQGAPIVGDPLYGRGAGEGLPPLARMALHAASLTLPWRGAALNVRAELPTDLAEFERALG